MTCQITWIYINSSFDQDSIMLKTVINERVILSISLCSQAVCGGLQKLEGYPSVSCGLHDMRSVRHVKQGPSSLWIGGRLSGCGSAVLRFSCRCHAAFWPLEGASERGSLTLTAQELSAHLHGLRFCFTYNHIKISTNELLMLCSRLYHFKQWSDNVIIKC